MGWSWFFAIQAQFFLFGLIGLFLHEKGKLLGYVFCLGSVIVNILVLVIESAVNEYNPGNIFGLMNKDQFLETFVKLYNRISAFAIGLLGLYVKIILKKGPSRLFKKTLSLIL